MVDSPEPDLRQRLLIADVAALAGAWAFVAVLWWLRNEPLWHIGALWATGVIIGIWALFANELYLARVATVRSVELSRLFRVAVVLAFAQVVVLRVLHLDLRIRDVFLGALISLLTLTIGRSAYRAWVATARRAGRFTRDVLVVGANREAAELIEMINEHPETGIRVSGVVGDRVEAAVNGMMPIWHGVAEDSVAVLREKEGSGVILVTSALETDELSILVRELQAKQIHIQLSNGVRGINFRRLRAVPVVHEPLFYVEQSTLRKREVVVKRVFDILISGLALLVLSPVIALISLMIKLGDRGPVFFAQTRVGRDNRQFKVLKFRSMVVDAEARLRELQQDNERTGPLFKMDRDPRITRIGHFLRETSLDELPQLINVLKGEMSIVGPRPALPSEVAQFDARLLERSKVRPGITGLWQVEARDNPSFNAYRRLDLFYVDNWTVTLDFVIILATVEQVIAKGVRMLRRTGHADAELSGSVEATRAA